MDDQVDQAEATATASPLPANVDGIVVSVCTTCKPAGGDATIGQSLLDATRAAVDIGTTVRAVQCLGVCKRPGTVAVTAPDRYTFIFGDLQGEAGATAIAAFVKSYAKAHFGLVPWRERAESIRRGLVARIPPAIWSPVDGSPPK
jgi:predicted metal-binding protein